MATDGKPTGGGMMPGGGSALDAQPAAETPEEHLIDEALTETFPASDPISPSVDAKQAPPDTPGTEPVSSTEPFPFPKSGQTPR